ncbi:nicotinamide riboside kinase 1-like [Clavelina lepadiformis]|uniref:nicotinamide riboside kinase 1-like n=1 Tax=Clavelina lepadiformis TaxID=159417 RepID=UPI00404261C6
MNRIENGILVIGISGVSNGGKTTLVSLLKKLFKQNVLCYCVGQDTYFKDESDVESDEATGLLRWDELCSFKMDEMCDEVNSILEHLRASCSGAKNEIKAILLVEGILIFHEPNLNCLFNKRYFLTLPYDEAKSRRSKRVYVPADVANTFDSQVWPLYLKHRDILQERHEDLLEIDATCNLSDVLNVIKEDIRSSFWPKQTWPFA